MSEQENSQVVDLLSDISKQIADIRCQLVGIKHNALWDAPWLNAQEMAGLLGLSAGQLMEKTRAGYIPGHKAPGCGAWMYDPREVSDAIRGAGRESEAAQAQRIERTVERLREKVRLSQQRQA